MAEADDRKMCLELMETAPAVYLTTIGEDGYPHTRGMLNLRNRENYPKQAHLVADHQDDFMVLLSTNTSSNKIKQILANGKGCVYYCDPLEFKGVMFAGDIEIVDDSKIRHGLWNEGWEKYYPGGADDPDHTVLRLYPKYAKGWYGFQKFGFEVG